MDAADSIFRTIEDTCRRCIHCNTEYAGDCELLAVGLRKVVEKDSAWLVCDGFATVKPERFGHETVNLRHSGEECEHEQNRCEDQGFSMVEPQK